MLVKQIIGRGMLAGAVAALTAFIFARIFVAPQTQRAVDYEEGIAAVREGIEHGAAHGASGEDTELFSRAVQMNAGMGFGILAYCLAIGALFAVIFAASYGRVGSISARLLSLYVAGGMLLSLYAVPGLKYPTNPPALSLDETVRERTLLWVLMVALSAGLSVGAVYLGRRLAASIGAWHAAVAAVGAYVVAIGAVMLLMPTVDETPAPLRDNSGAIVYEGFPADVLYYFRLYALGTQVVMYATIALVFAALMSRLIHDSRRQEA